MEDFTDLLRPCFVSLVDILEHPNSANVKQEGRKKYICYICLEKFCTSEQLNQHKSQHDDDDNDEDTDDRFEKNANELPKLEVSTESNETVAATPDLGTDDTGSNFRCVPCDVWFQNQSDVRLHIHNANKCKYLCRMCKRYFSIKGGFIVHILQHNLPSRKVVGCSRNVKRNFRCKQCDGCFEERAELMRHHVTVHSISHQLTEIDSSNTPGQVITYSSDPSNPITGTIPIYDCSICYDVFASAKALRRHQEMHKQIRQNQDGSEYPVSVEDSDIQVVQEDCRLTPHNVISNFTVAPISCNAKASPLRKTLGSPMVPSRKRQNRLSPPVHFVKKPIKSTEKMVQNSSVNQSQFVNDSALGHVSNSVAVSQGLQLINIGNPGVTTVQSPLSQPGQSYILINHGNFPVGAVNTTMPGMTQIPHSISHAISSTTAVTSNSPMTNSSLMINSEVNPTTQATFLNSLSEFSTMEPGKPLYFLVPAKQQDTGNQKTGVASTSQTEESNCRWMPALAPVTDRRTKTTKNKNVAQSGHFAGNMINNPTQQSSMLMPFITSVGSTIHISDEEDSGTTQSNSEFIMPIITSFGTVSDSSINKKSKSTEPATKYESEFQKFLKDGLNKNKVVCLDPSPRFKVKKNALSDSKATITQAGNVMVNTQVSEETLSEEPESDHSLRFPISTVTDPLSLENSSSSAIVANDTAKPKIFVKKLTDLIDNPRKSPDTCAQFYCHPCKQYFYRWLNYKNHMEQQHHKFSCKFFRCKMFDDAGQLAEHMKEIHSCEYCKGEFRKLSAHVPLCSLRAQSVGEMKQANTEEMITYEVD